MTSFKKQIKDIFDKNREIICSAFPNENDKRALVSESSSIAGSCIPVTDNHWSHSNTITGICQYMAEGGGNDPQSLRIEVVIGHSSDLRNSPSNHNNSIARKLFKVQQFNAKKEI